MIFSVENALFEIKKQEVEMEDLLKSPPNENASLFAKKQSQSLQMARRLIKIHSLDGFLEMAKNDEIGILDWQKEGWKSWASELEAKINDH